MAEVAKTILNADKATYDGLRRGLEAGGQAVLGVCRPGLAAALHELRREFDFDVYPVVPNAPAYARDLADLGMIGVALKRLRRLPLAGWFRLMAYGLRSVRGALAQDFGTMLGVMIQMELPLFAPLRPPTVLLHAQMTDLVLACGNAAGFQSFARVARGYGAQPGLQTRNFGHLVPKLKQWRIDIPVVAAPFNPLGYQMRPSQEACEALLSQRHLTVIAENVLADGAVTMDRAGQYLRRHSLGAIVVDSDDLASGWGSWFGQ